MHVNRLKPFQTSAQFRNMFWSSGDNQVSGGGEESENESEGDDEFSKFSGSSGNSDSSGDEYVPIEVETRKRVNRESKATSNPEAGAEGGPVRRSGRKIRTPDRYGIQT